jgi:hypothetical protein
MFRLSGWSPEKVHKRPQKRDVRHDLLQHKYRDVWRIMHQGGWRIDQLAFWETGNVNGMDPVKIAGGLITISEFCKVSQLNSLFLWPPSVIRGILRSLRRMSPPPETLKTVLVPVAVIDPGLYLRAEKAMIDIREGVELATHLKVVCTVRGIVERMPQRKRASLFRGVLRELSERELLLLLVSCDVIQKDKVSILTEKEVLECFSLIRSLIRQKSQSIPWPDIPEPDNVETLCVYRFALGGLPSWAVPNDSGIMYVLERMFKKWLEADPLSSCGKILNAYRVDERSVWGFIVLASSSFTLYPCKIPLDKALRAVVHAMNLIPDFSENPD